MSSIENHLRELLGSPKPETHPEYEMRDALIHLLEIAAGVREAEREATPLSAGEGDEGFSPGLLLMQRGINEMHERMAVDKEAHLHAWSGDWPSETELRQGEDTPPPAPVQREAGVEALRESGFFDSYNAGNFACVDCGAPVLPGKDVKHLRDDCGYEPEPTPPPAPAHGDRHTLTCGCEDKPTSLAPAPVDGECYSCSCAGFTPTPPPAPVQRETAVEALVREVAAAIVEDSCDAADRNPGQEAWDDALTVAEVAVRHVRSLLVPLTLDDMGQVRGAVPGYGPTGAGEVVVRRDDAESVWAVAATVRNQDADAIAAGNRFRRALDGTR